MILQIAVICILFFFMVLSAGLLGNYISKKGIFRMPDLYFQLLFANMIIFGTIIYIIYHS